MSVIPIIASVHDVESAIRHGNRNPTSRWYISKRLSALELGDLVPSDWAVVSAGLPDFLKKDDDGDGEKKTCSQKDCNKDAVMFGKCKEHAKKKSVTAAALTRRQARGKMGGMTAAAEWDGDVHPRDRNGRFIEKFDIIDVFPSGLAADVGHFRGIAVGNRKGDMGDDQVVVKLDKDISFAGQTVKAGTELPVSVDDVESAPNPKARLDGKPAGPKTIPANEVVDDKAVAARVPSQKEIDAAEAQYEKNVAAKDKLKEGGAARAKAEENLVAFRARIDKMYNKDGSNAPGQLEAVPDIADDSEVREDMAALGIDSAEYDKIVAELDTEERVSPEAIYAEAVIERLVGDLDGYEDYVDDRITALFSQDHPLDVDAAALDVDGGLPDPDEDYAEDLEDEDGPLSDDASMSMEDDPDYQADASAADAPKPPSMAEQTKREAEARAKLEEAGFAWDSTYGSYRKDGDVTIQSVAGGEWRIYPPGTSMWSDDQSGVQKFDNLPDAADAAVEGVTKTMGAPLDDPDGFSFDGSESDLKAYRAKVDELVAEKEPTVPAGEYTDEIGAGYEAKQDPEATADQVVEADFVGMVEAIIEDGDAGDYTPEEIDGMVKRLDELGRHDVSKHLDNAATEAGTYDAFDDEGDGEGDDNPMDELRAEGPDGELDPDYLNGIAPIRDLFDVDSGIGGWASGLNDHTMTQLANSLEEYQDAPDSVDPYFRDKLDGLTEAATEMGIDDPTDLIEARRHIMNLGWAQAEQLQGILNGEPLGSHNPNALRNIADIMHVMPGSIRNFGDDHSFEELSDAIHHYLDNPGPADEDGPNLTDTLLLAQADLEDAGGDSAVQHGLEGWATAVFDEMGDDLAGAQQMVTGFVKSALERRRDPNQQKSWVASDAQQGHDAGVRHVDSYGAGMGGKDRLALFPIGDPRESNFGGYDVWHVNPDGTKNGGRGSFKDRASAQGYIDGYNQTWDERYGYDPDAEEERMRAWATGQDIDKVQSSLSSRQATLDDAIADLAKTPDDPIAKAAVAEAQHRVDTLQSIIDNWDSDSDVSIPESLPAGDPEPPQVKADQAEALNKLLLMSKSANKDSVAISEAEADQQIREIVGKVEAGDSTPDEAHKALAVLMTTMKLGGKQRKRYRELLDAHLGATDDDSAEVQAAAVAESLSDDNPVKSKLSAKAQAFMDKHSAGKVASEPTVYPQLYQPSSTTPPPAPAPAPAPVGAPSSANATRAPEDLTDADLATEVSKAKAEYDDAPYGSPDQKRFAARYRELRAEQRDRVEAKKTDQQLLSDVDAMIAEHNAEYGDNEPGATGLAEWRRESIIRDLKAGDETILVKGEIEHTVTRRQALAMLRAIGYDTSGIQAKPGKA